MPTTKSRHRRQITVALVVQTLAAGACMIPGAPGEESDAAGSDSAAPASATASSSPDSSDEGSTASVGDSTTPGADSTSGSEGETSSADTGSTGGAPPSSCETTDPPDVVWMQDFEDGPGDWSIEGGLWTLGTPVAPLGPDAHSGSTLMGTVLDGDYPDGYYDARLVSPEFVVPDAAERPHLRLWQWSALAAGDDGELQIRVDGGPWQTLAGSHFSGLTESWTQQVIPLSAYEYEAIQIAFYLDVNGASGHPELGWYVDDVSLETGDMTFDCSAGFEEGFGDWSVEGGMWTRGQPTAEFGPSSYMGEAVVGTTLDGEYSNGYQDARLVTPEFLVPAASANPRLRLHHWYEFGAGDDGQVQISIDGGTWINIAGTYFQGESGAWSQLIVPLSSYEMERVRLAFYFDANGSNQEMALGWYVDDVTLESD